MRKSVVLEYRKILLVPCLAVCLASNVGAQAEDRFASGVTLHRDANFQGISETFYADTPDLRNSRIGDDQASSLSLGDGCQARIYAKSNYTGAFLQLAFGVADLSGSRVGNDAISSLKVRCGDAHWGDSDSGSSIGGGSSGGDSSHGVTLYRDLGYSGTSQTFTDDVADLRRSYVGNDTATAVRVSRGCLARLYADVDYRGSFIEVDRDISDLRGSTIGNDSATSMKVRCEDDGEGWGDGGGWNNGDGEWVDDIPTYGITLYRDLGFVGTSQTFTEDVSDLRNTFIGNDSTTSVRVSSGCHTRLHADANFQGAYIEVDRDIPDLRGSSVGNDRVSSIQVRCEGNRDRWSDGDSSQPASVRVTLYEDTSFRGAAYSFDSDVGDLRSTFGANDEASSVRVAPGCTVRLFQDPQFRGAYTETGRDISDLRNSRAGNDSISSLQVRCR